MFEDHLYIETISLTIENIPNMTTGLIFMDDYLT